MPDSCRLQAEFLEMNPYCNVVRTNGYIVPQDNLDLQTTPIEKHPERIKSNIFIDLIKGETNNWAGAYMVRAELHRQFYDTHVFPISRYGQNLQFLLPQLVDSPAGFIDQPLFKYIRYSGSHSNQPSYEKQMENLQGYWDIRKKILEVLAITDRNILKTCNISYYRRAFQIALDFQRYKDADSYYFKLKKMQGLSLEIKYQQSCHKRTLLRFWYRLNLGIMNIFTYVI